MKTYKDEIILIILEMASKNNVFASKIFRNTVLSEGTAKRYIVYLQHRKYIEEIKTNKRTRAYIITQKGKDYMERLING